MDFVEKLCKREHEQIYLFIAKCGQLWIKSVQLIFCKDNANSNKVFRTCLNFFKYDLCSTNIHVDGILV